VATGLLQDSLSAWPAAAVRDTVVAITQDPAFDRSLTKSVWEQIVEMIGRALGALFRMLPRLEFGNALIVVLALALVALVVARLVLQSRAQREFWAGERRDARAGRRLDPWSEAQRLADSGAFLEAAHHLCAALLAASARRGEVTLHPAKTTGDYARELRRRGAASERDFQRFRTRYDRVVYDAQACSADDYAALVADAQPLLARERAA
jgi:hypothetical protein